VIVIVIVIVIVCVPEMCAGLVVPVLEHLESANIEPVHDNIRDREDVQVVVDTRWPVYEVDELLAQVKGVDVEVGLEQDVSEDEDSMLLGCRRRHYRLLSNDTGEPFDEFVDGDPKGVPVEVVLVTISLVSGALQLRAQTVQ